MAQASSSSGSASSWLPKLPLTVSVEGVPAGGLDKERKIRTKTTTTLVINDYDETWVNLFLERSQRSGSGSGSALLFPGMDMDKHVIRILVTQGLQNVGTGGPFVLNSAVGVLLAHPFIKEMDLDSEILTLEVVPLQGEWEYGAPPTVLLPDAHGQGRSRMTAYEKARLYQERCSHSQNETGTGTGTGTGKSSGSLGSGFRFEGGSK